MTTRSAWSMSCVGVVAHDVEEVLRHSDENAHGNCYLHVMHAPCS